MLHFISKVVQYNVINWRFCCRQFSAELPPQMWYMVKCFYLLLSAYQIRSGYPTRILGNVLCKRYNVVNMVLFKGYGVIVSLGHYMNLLSLLMHFLLCISVKLQAGLVLHDFFLYCFALKRDTNIHHFLNLHNNFQLNAIWQTVHGHIYCVYWVSRM